jgi:putative Mg2+ transporter-C (MgtC) family protein
MDFLTTLSHAYIVQLVVAMFLGMSIGLERRIAGKTAGLRTYGLVALGSCLFMIVLEASGKSVRVEVSDLVHVMAGIITGIGFLGAGVIIFRHDSVVGLTTAAGLWVAAGIGVAVGLGLYAIAVATTLLTLLAFTAFGMVEHRVIEMKEKSDGL